MENDKTCYNRVDALKKVFEVEYISPRQRKQSPQNNFQRTENHVSNWKNGTKMYSTHCEKQSDIESENSDCDTPEAELSSKPEQIAQECLSYIENVNRCLTNLMIFKRSLDAQFKEDSEAMKLLGTVFRDVPSLLKTYQIINETIIRLRTRNRAFYIYEILLDNIVPSLLKFYHPFLKDYAANAKSLGQFSRENAECLESCNRVKKVHGIQDNINLDNCLYTVFNSLFSMELMFDRYRKCFHETSDHYKKAYDAKMVISNLLSSINTSNDQMKFLEAQKELSLLTGKTEKARINITFIHKGQVTKYARRDDKQMPRQLVLFSDCLFVTYLPNSISGTSKVRHELSTDSMELSEIRDTNIRDMGKMKWGLNINAKESVQDFCFDSEETMQLWKDKLLSVIKDDQCPIKPTITNSDDSLFWIGSKAPRWQVDSAAGFCNGYSCSQKFSTSVRRHHCRADGLLYCDACCNHKIKLSFEHQAESKVCQLCHNILFTFKDNPKQLDESKKMLNLVFSKMNHTGKKCGWLLVRKYNNMKGCFMADVNYYCVMDAKDAFLSLHERHEDKYKADGIILLGMEIMAGSDSSNFYKGFSSKQFTIEGEKSLRNDAYLMTAPTKEECKSWVESLRHRILTTINEGPE